MAAQEPETGSANDSPGSQPSGDSAVQESAAQSRVPTAASGRSKAQTQRRQGRESEPSPLASGSQADHEDPGADEASVLLSGPTADEIQKEDLPDELEEAPLRTTFDDSRLPYWARQFSSNQLYTLQQLKVENDAKATGTRGDQAPRLIRSFVDLLDTVEKRLARLEEKVATDSDETGKYNQGLSAEEDKNIRPRFYSAENQVRRRGARSEEKMWTVKGSFDSEKDPKHWLRVLFRWRSGDGERSDASINDDPPEPQAIVLEELRIGSKAVVEFIEKLSTVELRERGVIRMKKPFRMLVFSMTAFREQLKFLESRYGQVATQPMNGASESDASAGLSEPADTNKDTTTAFGQAEALPDFRTFVAFLDKYLNEQLTMFDEYQKGLRPKICFADLWMLFPSNELIHFKPGGGSRIRFIEGSTYRPSKWVWEFRNQETPQLTRTLAISGGVPTATDDNFGGFGFNNGMAVGFFTSGARNLSSATSKRARDSFSELVIECYYIAFDGTKFTPVLTAHRVRPFDGDVEIRDMDVFPLRYCDGSSSQPDLEFYKARGERYAALAAVSHKDFKGVTLGDEREEVNSRVIVDFKTAFLLGGWTLDDRTTLLPDQDFAAHIQEIPRRTCDHFQCHQLDCLVDQYFQEQRLSGGKALSSVRHQVEAVYRSNTGNNVQEMMLAREKLADQNLLQLLDGTAYAYVLRTRKWVEVDVNDLRDVVQDLSWDDLVLPKGHKELVQALVQTHTAGLASDRGTEAQRFEVDLVRGKGSGCIILLHGEPGVGKTSTAECVAAFTKRPLYPITCGDIGTTPSEVEENLEKHFNLAHKWGCVLLLDEADIFLARRSKAGDDISRNGLVSVFLRILEYYSGILFLTTNRVGTFDGAFRSRIHLMLYYPKLTEKQALQIFDNNLNRIEEYNATRRKQGKPEVEISDKEIHKWAKKRLTSSDKSRIYWNGRQIRNAFQTALALAEFEAQQQQSKQTAKAWTAAETAEPAPPKVTKEHFKRIAKAIAHFDNYLKEVHFGQDEDSIARRNEERGDNTSRSKQRKTDKKDESDTSDEETEASSASSGDDKSSDSDDDDSDKGKSKRKKKGKSKK